MADSSGVINVLHVDDEPEFVEVAATLLEREDERFAVETATDVDAGLDRLDGDDIDCVVSDYQMPDMDGLSFLDAVREEHPDLPFILFTGKGSEGIASEAISAGVTDYLQKGSGTEQYAILSNRIANAVEKARIQHQRERHVQAMEVAREGISLLDEEGRFTYVNRTYADLYGYESGELLGEHWEVLYPDDEAERVRDEIVPKLQAEGSWRGETIGQRRDGETFVEDHSLALTDDGRMVCIVGDATGETERTEGRGGESVGGGGDPGREGRREQDPRRYREELYELLTDRDVGFDEKARALLALGCGHLDLAEGELVRVDAAAGTHETVAVAHDRSREGTERDLDRTYCRHVVNDDGRLAVPNVDAAELADDPAREATPHGCYIGAPVTVDGETYGTVCFHDREPRGRFTRAEETFVDLVAGGLGAELERRRHRTELHQYRKMIDAVGDMVYTLDDGGRFEFVNAAAEQLTGYEREELIGEHVGTLMSEADLETGRDVIRDLLRDDEDRRSGAFEWTLYTADGETVPCETHLTLRHADGEWAGTVGVVRDMTERKERERELEMYEAAVEAARDGISVLDTDGTYRMVNGVFAEVVGLSKDEIVGRDPTFLIDHGVIDESAVETGVEKVLEHLDDEGEQITFETRVGSPTFGEEIVEHNLALLSADGDEGPDLGTDGTVPPVPVAADVESIEGAVMTHHKVTERKERERELEARERELERKNERLEEFVSVVSHDLRNPLNVATGGLALLVEDGEDGDDEHVERIERAHARMERIIEDLLDLARQGNSVQNFEAVESARAVDSAWGTVETAEAELHADWDARIEADGGRLQQLLENLFRNAIEHAGADVRVRVGPLADGSGFYVADDGPGIPEEKRERVFDSGYSTGEGNTGLGLNIVAEIAEAHGWEVAVTAGEDGGARFEITGVDVVEPADSGGTT